MVSAEEPASVRLLFADTQENKRVPVWYEHTARLSAGAKAYPTGANADALPLMGSSGKYTLDENSRLVFEAKGDAADIIESEECQGEIPVVLIDKKTGSRIQRILRLGDTGGDFVGFLSTADVTLNTSDYVKVGHFVVPAGYKLQLDPTRKVHVYLGDDTA